MTESVPGVILAFALSLVAASAVSASATAVTAGPESGGWHAVGVPGATGSSAVPVATVRTGLSRSAESGPAPEDGEHTAGADGEPTAGMDGEPTAGGDGEPTVSVRVARAGPETVRYDLSLSAPPGTERLVVVFRGPVTVAEAPGFERATAVNATRLRWTGERPAAVSVTVPASASGGAADSGWAFGRGPFVEVQWAADGTVQRSWPLLDRTGPVAGEGVVGDRYALVGAHEVTERSAGDRRVRVVVPAGVTPAARPGAVAAALADAAWRLDVGDADESLLAFAVADPDHRGGEALPAHDEFWVHAGMGLADPENVWLHEYVHARQSFRLATEMRWFREASAEYYAARLSYEQGLVGRGEMRSHLGGPPSRATLTDPGTWTCPAVPRRKGARTLAVLDRKIRAESDGHRSLQDVFRRLNDHDGPVTYDAFVQTVSEVAGRPMDDWLDAHVAGSEPVADQYPPAPLLGAGLAGPGLLGTGGGESFFAVSVAFAALAAGPLYAFLGRRDPDEIAGEDPQRTPSGTVD